LCWGVMDEAFRTRAVTAWARRSASSITSLPVRPLPPRRRMCAGVEVGWDLFNGVVGEIYGLAAGGRGVVDSAVGQWTQRVIRRPRSGSRSGCSGCCACESKLLGAVLSLYVCIYPPLLSFGRRGIRIRRRRIGDETGVQPCHFAVATATPSFLPSSIQHTRWGALIRSIVRSVSWSVVKIARTFDA
jgi:hypothetical protein